MNSKLFALIFISWSTFTFAQRPKDQLKIANSASLDKTDFYEEIPFIDRGGYFIIPVSIGNETYEYIFDTGGFNTVTTEIMTSNNLPELMKVPVGSSNQLKSTISLSKIPALSVGHVPFVDVGVFNFNFDESPIIKCYTNGGLLGKAVIKQAIWQIDYANRVIRVADKIDKMPNLEHSTSLKVHLTKILDPFVEIEINGRKQNFMLDFGFGGFISLTEKTAKEYTFASTLESVGEGAIGANGLTEEPIFISALSSVKIAGQNFKNQVAFHAKSNNYNLIGSELAKHFIVTLNFPENELILTPAPQTQFAPFKTFGISLNVNDKEIYVNRIYKGSSANQQGIQLNDKVLQVNEIRVDTTNICDSFLRMRNAMDKAEQLKIKVLRNSSEYNFDLFAEELKWK